MHNAPAMRRCLMLAVLLTTHAAHADGDWIAGVQAGAVAAHVDAEYDFEDGSSSTGSSLTLELSRRIHPRVAIGARLAIDGEVTRNEYEHRSMFDLSWDIQYRPIFVGVSASYFPTARTWITPWLGVAHDWDLRECTTEYRPTGESSMGCGEPGGTPRDDAFAYGIGGGIDLFATGPHRGGLAASIARARDGEYTSFGLSLAYRYW